MLKFKITTKQTNLYTIFGKNLKLEKNMKIQLKRNGEILEIENFVIEVEKKRFRIAECYDGKISINKVALEGSDYINIHPVSGNEIELS